MVRVSPTVQLAERKGPDGSGRLVFHGLATCGSVHSCPMCAAVIMRERSAEITQALDKVQRERSAFVTFTARHHQAMMLGPLRKLLALAYSELKAGRAGAELKSAIGYVGDVKAAEQTWGVKNGWHPHFHAMWLFDRPLVPELEALLSDRWRLCLVNAWQRLNLTIEALLKTRGLGTDAERSRAVKLFGRRYVREGVSLVEAAVWFRSELRTLGSPDDFLPDHEHGVKALAPNDTDDVGQYLAKLGLELTGISQKTSKPGHFTSWDIARRAARGSARFEELWQEHSRVMFGARQLTWSRGLRERLGLEPERSDEELAADPLKAEETETLLGEVAGPLWDQRTKIAGQSLVAELLTAYHEQRVQGHELVTPRDGVRSVRPKTDTAPTVWERWQREAQARERGRARLPGKRRRRSEDTLSIWAFQESLEELRALLYEEQGIKGKTKQHGKRTEERNEDR